MSITKEVSKLKKKINHRSIEVLHRKRTKPLPESWLKIIDLAI